MAAGDGKAVRAKLGIDVGELWCSSGEDEGTKGATVCNDPSGTVNSARAAA
jgi:hypothetical protein